MTIQCTTKHWYENIVILTKFSSLAALQVVILTTCDAASDENFVKMTTFPFQWTRCMFHGINCKYIKVYIIAQTPCDNHRSQGRSERPAHVAFKKTFHFQLAPLLIDYELRMTTVSNLENNIIVYLIVVRIWFFPCYSVCSQSDTFSFVHLTCFSTSLNAGKHVRLRKHRRMYVYMCVLYIYI